MRFKNCIIIIIIIIILKLKATALFVVQLFDSWCDLSGFKWQSLKKPSQVNQCWNDWIMLASTFFYPLESKSAVA